MKELYCAFMRANPPHLGHVRLITHMRKLAAERNAECRVYLSHSFNEKNPLPPMEKLPYLKFLTGASDAQILLNAKVTSMMSMLEFLDAEKKWDVIHLVCGEDRASEYKQKIEQQTASGNLKVIFDVVSIARDAISGTSLRKAVQANDSAEFYKQYESVSRAQVIGLFLKLKQWTAYHNK